MVEGDYKLIWFFGDYIDREQDSKYIIGERIELYNLKKDIGEKNSLSKQDTEKTREMQTKLKEWILSCGEQIPELNQQYDPENWDQRVNPKKED
jgi:hypothetical protein